MSENLRPPWPLTRRLVFFDVETTGVDWRNDRIVELALVIYEPHSDSPIVKSRRFNPGVRIPEEATAVHGITDEDVADLPGFAQFTKSLLSVLGDADLGGFNIRAFDLPMLVAEFERAGHDFDVSGRAIVDVQVVFHEQEPRTLEAAVQFYVGAEHDAAHEAEADTLATAEVFWAQVGRYGADLGEGLQEISDAQDRTRPVRSPVGDWFEQKGPTRATWVVRRGQHRGQSLDSLPRDYLIWMASKADDMHPSVREIARQSLEGVWE